MLARYNEIPRTASWVIVLAGVVLTPSSRRSTPPQRGPRYRRQNSGASTGRWNAPMYQDRKNCRMCATDKRLRDQCPMWSRHGPEIEVNVLIRAPGVVTASHDWIEPQSWPTTCTGSSGLTS